MKEAVHSVQEKLGAKLFASVSRGVMPGETLYIHIFTPYRVAFLAGADLLDSDDLVKLKRSILACQRKELPPIVTHNMKDDTGDTILNHLRRVRLFNQSSDRVKVVYHPEFITATNPLFSMDYEEFVRGTHLGTFHSDRSIAMNNTVIFHKYWKYSLVSRNSG